jgi:hypothetical protein
MMEVIYIGLAALAGGIVIALLGWTETKESFDARKFSSSIIRAIIGAAVIAAGFNYAGATSPIMYLFAFLGGAGFDAGGKRIAGAIAARGAK